jgi:hypothetical protein
MARHYTVGLGLYIHCSYLPSWREKYKNSKKTFYLARRATK